MEWAVLAHVLVAFGFVAGMVGRNVIISQARRSTDITAVTELMAAASRFDMLVKVGSLGVLVLGLLAMFIGELSLSEHGWLVVSLVLYVTLAALVPLVFMPRGKVFDAAMAGARQLGEVTPELTTAFRDPFVSVARNAEMVAVVVIIALMVLKPF